MFTRVYVRRTTAVLSSGKWNKQSTSHYISPQWLDETRQELTAPPPPHARIRLTRPWPKCANTNGVLGRGCSRLTQMVEAFVGGFLLHPALFSAGVRVCSSHLGHWSFCLTLTQRSTSTCNI